MRRTTRRRVLVSWEGEPQVHELPAAGTIVFGRSQLCDVRIDHASVSRRHAALHLGASLRIEDLGSSNGTRVRGELIFPGRRLAFEPGDALEIGRVVVRIVRSARTTVEAKSSAGAVAARRSTTTTTPPPRPSSTRRVRPALKKTRG